MNGRKPRELAGVSHLGGKKTSYGFAYDPTLLEAFPNKNPESIQWVTCVCTEFTSLCPRTGQPDYARIFINYIAGKKMVESKSLKLYLFSFRNHGDFHEDCVQKICGDLRSLLRPRYIEVLGEFTPRGGIALYPFASSHNGEKAFAELHRERLTSYAPGKFSMPLGRPY
ncbi:MAG: preQ(1) synthase [Elusimicrobia bacterium]|nr:preQ(1) synthase [Elusimicrobiota bacterium]